MLVCMPILSRMETETSRRMEITDDPEDPIFYSTCYDIQNPINFIGFDSPAPEPLVKGEFVFEDKCISCQSQQVNMAIKAPTWRIEDKCYNCEITPDTTSKRSDILPSLRLMKTNIDCNVASVTTPITNTITCPTANWCTKTLKNFLLGQDDNAGADAYTYDECAAIAAKDPECSDIVVSRNAEFASGLPLKQGCKCYRNDPCCGAPCGGMNTKKSTSTNLFKVMIGSEAPDPTCANGFISKDGSKCCDYKMDDTKDPAGMCCGYSALSSASSITASGPCIPATRRCDAVGAPCVIKVTPTPCGTNQRVMGNMCVACPAGMSNAAGDDVFGADTTCDPIICAVNQFVKSKVCTNCPAGTKRAAGDVATGADTSCTPTLCAVNQYVLKNVCTNCPTGQTSAAGASASGPDTTCTAAP
jgi:hypothetical protein